MTRSYSMEEGRVLRSAFPRTNPHADGPAQYATGNYWPDELERRAADAEWLAPRLRQAAAALRREIGAHMAPPVQSATEQLTAARRTEAETKAETAKLLNELLNQFTEHAHIGHDCVRTAWHSVKTVERWRARAESLTSGEPE